MTPDNNTIMYLEYIYIVRQPRQGIYGKSWQFTEEHLRLRLHVGGFRLSAASPVHNVH